MLFKFATEIPYRFCQKYKFPNIEVKNSPFEGKNFENLEEKFDDLAEEFLDEVFEYESKIPREEWEKDVAKKQAYIFVPEKIRQKIASNIDMNVSYSSRRSTRKL